MSDRRLDNWIKAYLAYTAETESPEEYHIWNALSCIAGALRRKCFFDMRYFLVRPNLYVVLVGPAGRCKKSTSMRIGRAMISHIPGLNFTTDSVTRERLIQDLSQTFVDGHSSMTAYSSEFASLLTSSGMDMVVFLTDIYDSPNEWSHRTKSGGTNIIKAPYLNLIGATTPDWIAKSMPLDTVGIGLTSRIIFVYSETPRVRDAFPNPTSEQMALRELLIEDLNTMSTIAGEFTFNQETRKAYSEWYKSRIQDPNTTGDPRLNGYFERKPMHIIKLCMIISASFSSSREMTIRDFQTALELIEQVESSMPRVFASVGKNPLVTDYDAVASAIYSHEDGMTFDQLLRTFRHSVRKDELGEVLETLIESKRIIPGPGRKYLPMKGKDPIYAQDS